MARLEFILYTPMREVVANKRTSWIPEALARPITKLPQIYWDNSVPWHEANHWAITKLMSSTVGRISTVDSLMKHLCAYAAWLESNHLDWRHFPSRKQDRALVLFRGELIAQRSRGELAASTASARMAAVIQFYRHAHQYKFMHEHSLPWADRQIVVRYYDSVGFERTFKRLSSDLSIPNRARPGLRLEDGLTPLRKEDAKKLLEFTKTQGLIELSLILSLGVLTGARIGTIATLNIKALENAYPDSQIPNIYRLRVGPGTGVRTKFDVGGELMVPKFLLEDLKHYAYSMQRLKRLALATKANRELLFLTVRGSPYAAGTFSRLMTDLRRRSQAAGLRFMANFKFHQTRATFGTWLMEVALVTTDSKTAVAFVRDAMLHKDERTTLLYVRFIEQAPVKEQVVNEFSTVFSGLKNRDWNQFHA